MQYREYNFDGLVGPTHNYAGLAIGNIASSTNAASESNPKEAALQGLAKMKALADMGLAQAVLPPQPRPDMRFLRNLGFTGSNEQVLKAALQQAPKLFAASYSASSMWTANAATVSPSPDSVDNKVHFTPANLACNIHRSIEAQTTYNIFCKIFENTHYFHVHKYLPHNQELGDEGAANHTRFCTDYGSTGVACFVYGQEYYNRTQAKPKHYPARQTLEASMSIARQHGLDLKKTIYLQQNPDAIDAGCFHNDVCAVGNQNVLLCHEQAFANQKQSLSNLVNMCAEQDINLYIHEVNASDIPMADMVQSYLFNSQLVTVSPGVMALIAPKESQENTYASNVINKLLAESPIIKNVVYVDCRQSMRNGGGPACLRLRVVLSECQAQAINTNVLFSQQLYTDLQHWIQKYYRDRLVIEDLLDPSLINECHTALEELTKILKLGSVYDFQQE